MDTTKPKRARGSGSVRKRAKGGYAICYYRHGKEIRESVAKALRKPAHVITEQDAERLLRTRLRDVASGRFVGPAHERRTVEQILEDYWKHLQARGAKAVGRSRAHIDHVIDAMGHQRAVDVRGPMVEAWGLDMLKDGYARATVNVGISYLKAALRLAHKHEQLAVVPYLSLLSVNNARSGFFEHHEFLAVAKHLEQVTAEVAWFGYLTAARSEEILGLGWEHVDRLHRHVTFVDTKNGDNRQVPLDDRDERGHWRNLDLWRLIERRWEARKVGGDSLAEWVFHRDGRRVRFFWGYWHKACLAAELPGKLFHDLRRTAIRNWVRAGVPEAVAMRWSGHRTRSIFTRYNIVSDADMRSALSRSQAYLATPTNVVPLAVHGQGHGQSGQ